jgi:TP901 family phage tail tape measure protein
MSELSAQFDAISPDMDIDTATNGLVSTMAAFNLGVDDVKDGIMSKINAIGNAFATSNGEIIEGLEKDAASMNAANNSLEQTIALFTSGVEITRDAESMGSALKTISMRIRGYDEETEELSEEYENLSGDIADLTKTASTQGGISLFTDETKETYKSTYQILKEISQIWDELSDKNQAELLEKLFAKTRANQGAAIISNFSQAEKAIEVMENSAGSADAELETYTQSIEYKLNRLTETWTGTWQNLIDRGTIGTVVDSLTSVSEALGWVIDNVGLLGAAGIGLGTLITKNNVGREKCYPSVDMPTIVKLPV